MPVEKDPTGEYKNYDAISKAAVQLAEKIKADLIVAATKTGATAALIAAQRPNIPILTVTSSPRVAQQLALTYSNSAFVRPYTSGYAMDLVNELKSTGYLHVPEAKEYLTVVMLSGVAKDEAGGTDSIQIRRI